MYVLARCGRRKGRPASSSSELHQLPDRAAGGKREWLHAAGCSMASARQCATARENPLAEQHRPGSRNAQCQLVNLSEFFLKIRWLSRRAVTQLRRRAVTPLLLQKWRPTRVHCRACGCECRQSIRLPGTPASATSRACSSHRVWDHRRARDNTTRVAGTAVKRVSGSL